VGSSPTRRTRIKMRTPEEVARVLALHRAGLNDCAISRATGIPRPTVHMWRSGRVPAQERMAESKCEVCIGAAHPRLPSREYAYLLGQYLGDGSITRMHRGVFLLRIFTDARYPGIIEECAGAVSAVLPRNKVAIAPAHDAAMLVISSSSKHWPCLFPQHGSGMKHTRTIMLAAWQEPIAQAHPEALLRGLIHSDGCRVLNRVKKRKYAYPRYQFSQVSDDIRRIFTDSCDQLGIAWRRMNRTNISIARRDAVALMDTFVGPKT
jgi:hypothetical protein